MGLSWSQVWELVHDERRRLVADLATLPEARWQTPSLCPGWSVHDVLAHLLDTALTGRAGFAWSMVRARGDFDRANADGVHRRRHPDPQRTLAAFRHAVGLRRTPPAHRATRLVEAVVHGEDIRRPLGLTGSYPRAGVHEALAYQLRTPVRFGGGRERAAGYRLVETGSEAVDPPSGSWGQGPEVRGSAVDLLLTVSGRRIEPAVLSGPGAPALIEHVHDGPPRDDL